MLILQNNHNTQSSWTYAQPLHLMVAVTMSTCLTNGFYRLVGWRGNLLSHYPDDGDLYVSMEAPNDYFILELMLKDEDKPRARGCIEMYDGLGDLPMRRIQFNEGCIWRYKLSEDTILC